VINVFKKFVVTLIIFVGCGQMTDNTGNLSGTTPITTPAATTSYSGYVLVTSYSLDTVTMFDPNGNYVRTLRSQDTADGQTFFGLVPYDSTSFLLSVDGTDRVERIRYDGQSNSIYLISSLLTGTIRRLTRLSNGDIVVSENTIIEKFDANLDRVGAPFIAANATAACATAASMTGIMSIMLLSSNEYLVVDYDRDHLFWFDIDGNYVRCLNITDAEDPYDAVEITGSKIAVVHRRTDSIYTYNLDGSSAQLLYDDDTYISDPRSIAVDNDGNILVGSWAYDTVEKITTSGTRVGSSAFINEREIITDPYSIMVVP
jgi:hypothetical protein